MSKKRKIYPPSIKNWMNERLVERNKSPIHGWGIFALETIKKNTRILQYRGERISQKESRRRELRYLKRGQLWCFELNANWVIDAAVGGSLAKYVNHDSKNPNCWTEIKKGEIWYVAGRTIHPGEELTVNYHADIPQAPKKPKKKGNLG